MQVIKKEKKKKKRRARNKISKSPITTIQGQDSEIHFPKRKLFTEYYQKNEQFEILLLNNPECEKSRSCISCKSTLTKRQTCSSR